MYNHLLDTFIKSAELGSFSKVANNYYISPSAVIQQMNQLENLIKTKLFDRTKKGISLTEAGEFLLIESKALIAQSNYILEHLKNMSITESNNVNVGINPFHMPQLLYKFWNIYYLKNTNCTLSSYTFSDSGEGVKDNTDIIEGLNFNEPLWQKNFKFYKINEVKIKLLMSKHASLSKHSILSWIDIKNATIVNIKDGVNNITDEINSELIKNNIKLIKIDIYSTANIIQYLAKDYYVIIPECWLGFHPDSKMVDFTWNYTIPYGFFLSNTATKSAQELIKTIKQNLT